jgi:D-alanyl-D-alanine carboxypeptidase
MLSAKDIKDIIKKLTGFRSYNQQPGILVEVFDSTGTVRKVAYGFENIKEKKSISFESLFPLCSITKIFTGLGITDLAKKKLIDLNDTIDNYFPQFAHFPLKPKIKDLLENRSGIRNFYEIDNWFSEEQHKNHDKNSMINLLSTLELDFKPGEKFAYSNSGFIILGAIIERVSGDSYLDYLKKNGLIPDYPSVGLITSQNSECFHLPTGYSTESDNTKAVDERLNGLAFSAGGLVMDFNTFSQLMLELYGYKIIPIYDLKSIWQIDSYKDSEGIEYAFGWYVSKIRSHQIVYHDGYFPGFRTLTYFIPSLGIGGNIFSNDEDFQTHALALCILDSQIANSNQDIDITTIQNSPTADILGGYGFDDEVDFNIEKKTNSLYIDKFNLEFLPVDKNIFHLSGARDFLLFCSESDEQVFLNLKSPFFDVKIPKLHIGK